MTSDYGEQLAIAHLKHTTDADVYWQLLLRRLPLGNLLDNPSGIDAKLPIHLVHATTRIDDILMSQQLLPGPGCLLSSVYTVPAIDKNGTITVHNYGDSVFRHIDPSVQFSQLLIQIQSTADIKTAGISYLLLGEYYFSIISTEASHIGSVPTDTKIREIRGLVGAHREFIDDTVYRYKTKQAFTTVDEASAFIDTVHNIANSLPVFAFSLFEAISQCLMLSSQDATTTSLHEQGEPHNGLYITLMHDIVEQHFSRFNAGLFNPSRSDLVEALKKGIDEGIYVIDIEALLIATTNQLTHLIGGQVCRTNDALVGHLLYLSLLKDDPKTATRITQRTNKNAYDFWSRHEIDLVYNATTVKGEVGVNPNLDTTKYEISLLKKAAPNSNALVVDKEIVVALQPGDTL